MDNLKGIDYLRKKLAQKRVRVLTRYKYYDMKDGHLDLSPVIPARLRMQYASQLGWCGTAVDFLADRLVVRGFDNDRFNLQGIYDLNSFGALTDSAILSALISSCCFIYISADANGFPRLQVIDGANATGSIDPITGLLREGYAVLERDPENGRPTLEAYFIPGETHYYYRSGALDIVKNPALYPLLVPIVYRPDAMRPFGHSRISRACMDLQDKAANTVTRAEVSAEFYSFPQKYVLGTDPNADPLEKWRATITSLLEITKDEDGDKPTVGQFQQQNVEPHISQFRLYAAAFCGETGLTLDDLGFVSENPSSAEAIKAGHESLRNTARKAQRNFGAGFVNAGYLAASLRDKAAYQRTDLYDTRCLWEPIIEPDAAMMSGIGDAVQKINLAVPEYFDKPKIDGLLGLR